jgi:hypothetical protein
MALHLFPMPGDQSVAAIGYGPLVLAAPEGTGGIIRPAPFSDPDKHNDYYTYNYHIPPGIPDTLQQWGSSNTDWIKPIPGEKLRFQAKDAKGHAVSLQPFYRIHRQRYVVYWRLAPQRN